MKKTVLLILSLAGLGVAFTGCASHETAEAAQMSQSSPSPETAAAPGQPDAGLSPAAVQPQSETEQPANIQQ